MARSLCIYHRNCLDGFAAACIVREKLGEHLVDFYAADYMEPPPEVTDRNVIMVDFSYPNEVLLQMAKDARSILILDHHDQSRRDFESIDKPLPNVTAIFDTSRSGAVVTWNYFHFHEGENVPFLLEYIEDYDLHIFKHQNTNEIIASLSSYPYDFDVWAKLFRRDIVDLIKEGRALYRKHMKDVRELIDNFATRTIVAGHDVPIINISHTYRNEVGAILAKNEPFSVSYYDTPTHRKYSLRSAPDGLNVSDIAMKFGGKGHATSAGFKLPHNELHRLSGE